MKSQAYAASLVALILLVIGCSHDPCVEASAEVMALFQDPAFAEISNFDNDGILVCEIGLYVIVTSGAEDAETLQIFRRTGSGLSSTKDAIFKDAIFSIFPNKTSADDGVDYTLWQHGSPDVTLVDADGDQSFDSLFYSVPIDGDRHHQLSITDRNFDGTANLKFSRVNGESRMSLWVQGAWRPMHIDPAGNTVMIDGVPTTFEWNGTKYAIRESLQSND